jgi:uncharacterized phage protein (TIGR01671 family)
VREIKFRAWDGTKMYNPILADGKTFRSGRDYEDYNDAPFDSVMQYTGLKDKNGVEIYEGDIFKTRNGVVAVVEWDENNGRFLGFTIERERKIVYVGQEPAVEVIGNIHQNADLLIKEE